MIFEKLGILIPKGKANTLAGYDVHLSSSKPTSGNREAKYRINHQSKVVTFYIPNLSVKEKRKLQRAIREEVGDDSAMLIKQAKFDLISRLYKYNNKSDNKILSFFQNVLSRPDWLVLRDSLFLRNEFKNDRSIALLKQDIISRYGERGNLISNLCTAGYFEETMIPLYNHSQEEFHKYYDIAVNRGITALFVNSHMSVEKIKSEIKGRLTSAKAYGLSDFHIHGIGKTNIAKIKQVLEQQKSSEGFQVKTTFEDEKLYVYVVEVIF